MRILISGSSGLVGTALMPKLSADGHEIVRLVRDASARGHTVQWDPALGNVDRERIKGFDALIHLAGENIASGRWTKARKKRIKDSRVEGTKLIAEALARQEKPPSVAICASATGYYGDRGDETLYEDSPPGKNFLADLCRKWEDAAEPLRKKGVRVTNLRTGIVLSKSGGALKKMLLPFKLGLGGIIGSGQQYWSWITLNDLNDSIRFILSNESIRGPVNAVSPTPSTNTEFTKTLGAILKRPTAIPLPALMARIALGQMAEELLLASARVIPQRLMTSGFRFQHSELEPALRDVLSKK